MKEKKESYGTNRVLPLQRERIILLVGCGIIAAALLLAFGGIFHNIRQVVRQTRKLLDTQAEVISGQTAGLLDDYRRLCEVLAVHRDVLEYAKYDGTEDKNLLTKAGYNLRKDLNTMCSMYGSDINTLAIYFARSEAVITMARQLEREKNTLFFDAYPLLSPQSLKRLSSENHWELHYGDEADPHYWIVRGVQIQNETVAYVIVEYNLDNFISRITTDDALVMIGSNDGLLYSNEEDRWKSGIDFAAVCAQAAQQQTFSVDGEEYLSRVRETRHPELKVVAGVPAARLRHITVMYAVIMVVTGLTVFLSLGILSFHLHRRLFSPLEYLIGTVDHQNGDTPQVLHLIADDFAAARSANEQMQVERDTMIPLALGRQLGRLAEADSDEQALLYAQSCLLLADIPQDGGFVVFAARCMEGQDFLKNAELEPGGRKKQEEFHSFPDSALNSLFLEFPGTAAPFRNDWYLIVASCSSAVEAEQVENIIDTLQDNWGGSNGGTLICTRVSWGISPVSFVYSVRQVSRQIFHLDFWGGSEESTGAEADDLSQFRIMVYKLFARLNAEDYEGSLALVDSMLESALPSDSTDVKTPRYRIYAMAALLIAAIDERMGSNPLPPPVRSYEQRLYRAESFKAFKKELKAVISELAAYKESQEAPAVNPGRIDEIKNYIQEHYMENELTAASVASAFGLNGSYLSRAFKKHTGVNILEYIQRLRVEAALQLLKTEDVKNVAQKVGFWDTRGFSRTFKKYENMTPAEYKRMLKDGEKWE